MLSKIRTGVLLAAAALPWAGGCLKPVYFPVEPARTIEQPVPTSVYDPLGDGKLTYRTLRNDEGRVDRIAYGPTAEGTSPAVVNLDAIGFAQCRHVVLILDGVGYDLVKKYREEGHLRLFHPPSRVIAPYPTLTDLCFEDFFGYLPVRGFESRYYDHKAGRVMGGSGAYLRGDNTPYNRLLHYRANMIFDAIGYVLPWQVFGKEINDAKRLIDRRQTQEVRCYFVSSAGVGTKMGAKGHRRCLEKVDQLVQQLVWETRGLVKVTLLSDHGHSYTPAEPVGLAEHLEAKGWRLTDRLRGPRDVAYIRFGLETYAALSTHSPQPLAADAVECEGVDLASCAVKGGVLVRAPGGGRATVRHKAGRFGYAPQEGDPLKLKGILATLTADADGLYGADDLLAATATHEYPAPLQRLWRAHFALVESPADVIVSLKDAYFSGSGGFSRFAQVASTHGSLNYNNSAAFILSTAGRLPPVMRSRDIPRHMKALTGRDWPAGR